MLVTYYEILKTAIYADQTYSKIAANQLSDCSLNRGRVHRRRHPSARTHTRTGWLWCFRAVTLMSQPCLQARARAHAAAHATKRVLECGVCFGNPSRWSSQQSGRRPVSWFVKTEFRVLARSRVPLPTRTIARRSRCVLDLEFRSFVQFSSSQRNYVFATR